MKEFYQLPKEIQEVAYTRYQEHIEKENTILRKKKKAEKLLLSLKEVLTKEVCELFTFEDTPEGFEYWENLGCI